MRKRKGIPFDLEEEISGVDRDRPPVNQAQNPMHELEIETERKRIFEELKKRDAAKRDYARLRGAKES